MKVVRRKLQVVIAIIALIAMTFTTAHPRPAYASGREESTSSTGEVGNKVSEFVTSIRQVFIQNNIENNPILQSPTGTVTIWYSYGDGSAEGNAFNQVIQNAEANNPGLDIVTEYHDFGSLVNDYRAATQSGNGPDMFIQPNDDIGNLVREGRLLNIDGYLSGQLTNVNQTAIDGMTVDGHLYGIPESIKAVVLYYNKSMITTPPATTGELLSMLQGGETLAVNGTAYHLYGFWSAFGGQLMDANGHCIADQGGFAPAMQYLLDLQNAGALLQLNNGQDYDKFVNGEAGLYIDGPWVLNELKGTLGSNLGVAVLPEGPSGIAKPLTGIDGFFVNPNTSDPANVVSVALYLTNQASSQLLTDAGGHIPVRSDVIASDPLINMFAQAASQGELRPQNPQYTNYWDPFGTMIGNVLTGVETPEIGVQNACAKMNGLNMRMQVRANNDGIDAIGWPMGVSVNLEIDDPGTTENPDYSSSKTISESTPWGSGETYAFFDLVNVLDIQPDFVITMTDGVVTKAHTVTSLTFTEINPENDTVTGTADINSRVNVWACNGPCGSFNRHMNTDSGGVWMADFAHPGLEQDEQEMIDIGPGTWIDSSQEDADFDSTMYGITVANPRFHVQLTQNNVEGYEWPVGASVTITIDTNHNGTAEFTSAPETVDGNGNVYFNNVGGIDLAAGMYVTMTDGTTTKTHTVTTLTLTSVDPVADKLTGTAPANGYMEVGHICDETGCAIRRISADATGNWTADFSIPGAGSDPDEQRLFDIKPGTGSEIRQPDEDGDHTDIEWYVPNPNMSVRPNNDQVEANEWPAGNTITVEVDDPSNGVGADYSTEALIEIPSWDPNRTYASVYTGDVLDIKPGFIVTMSDGTTTKSHTVTTLEFINIDTPSDVVTGIAEPNSHVDIWACDGGSWCVNRHFEADDNGEWTADFAHPGNEGDEQDTFDIMYGTWIDSSQYDSDGDSTMYGINVPNTRVEAIINENAIEAYEWPEDALLTLEIDDPNTTQPVDYTDSLTPSYADWDPNTTFARFELNDFKLEPGHSITLKDGKTTKHLLVVDLQLTGWDLAADTLSGKAPANTDVWTNIWDGDWKPRRVRSDEDGNWTANYHVVGDDDYEQFTYNIINGSTGDINISDEDNDATRYTWDTYTVWVAPNTVPFVAALTSDFDLKRPGYMVDDWTVLNLLYEPLFRLGDNSTVIPAAATGYTVSTNGLVYTITLRANKWSDGQPVTAQQYVNGFLRILNPNTAPDYAYLLFDIQGAEGYNNGSITRASEVGIKAISATTLQITLKQKTAYFPKILNLPGFFPVRMDVINLRGDAWVDPAYFVSNGPYKLVEHDGAHFLLAKNPQYYNNAKVSLTQIGLPIFRDPAEPFEAYKRGEVDAITAPTDTLNDPIYRFERVYSQSPGIFYIGFNVQFGPTDNTLVRQALAAATDRQALLDGVLDTPWRQTATGVIPPELPGYQGNNVGFEFNPTLAQDLLSQAGYPDGVGLPTIHLYGNTQPANQALLDTIAEQWRTVLHISVETHFRDDFGTWISDCENDSSACEYNGFRQGWYVDYYDANNILNDLFYPDYFGGRRMGWDNPQYRALIDQSRGELNNTTRISLLQQAEKILVEEDAAVIPLYFLDRVDLVKPGFKTVYGLVPYYEQWTYSAPVAPAAFSKTSPANNVLKQPVDLTLTWAVSTRAEEYEYCIDDINNNDCDTQWVVTDTPSISLTDLVNDKSYYWQVRANNAIGTTYANTGAWWNFKVIVSKPSLLSPADNDSVTTLRPAFDWTDVTETSVTGYTIQISTSSTFATIANTANVTVSNYTPTVDLPKGKLYWRVRVVSTNGPSAWSDVSAYQGPNPPAAPVLNTPVNNSLTTNYRPALKWTALVIPAGAPVFNKYQIQIATDQNFSSIFLEEDIVGGVANNQYTPDSALPSNTKYYWRVRGVDLLPEEGAWSAVWSFRTALTPPLLSEPSMAANPFELRPTFTWQSVATATGYTIQIAKNEAFTVLVHTGNPVGTSYVPTIDLPKNQLLYWRVLAKGTNGPSEWSEKRTFTSANSPTTPVLSLPAQNALNTDYTPLFKWSAVTVPVPSEFANYELQVSDDPNFVSWIIDDTSITLRTTTQFQVQPEDALPHNTKLYWRVRAVNKDNEVSNWSAVWTIRTRMDKPILLAPASGATPLELRPSFTWSAPAGPGAITGYTIQFSKSATFATILHTGNPAGTSYVPTIDLPKNQLLYWRVQAKGTNGPSGWTDEWSFTSANSPTTPVLKLPALNALSTDYRPLLKWSVATVTAPAVLKFYWVQVDNDSDFSSPITKEVGPTVTQLQMELADGLAHNTKYYWRVQAVNTDDEVSNWSTVWYFRTAIDAPILSAPADGDSNVSRTPHFDWSDVSENNGYVLQIWKVGTGSTAPVLVKTVTLLKNVSEYDLTTPLLANTAYYWKVQTKAVNGPSLWSESFDFVTGP